MKALFNKINHMDLDILVKIFNEVVKRMVRVESIDGYEVYVVSNFFPQAMINGCEIVFMTSALWNMGDDVRKAVLHHELGHKPHIREMREEILRSMLIISSIDDRDSMLTRIGKIVGAYKVFRNATRRQLQRELDADWNAVAEGYEAGLRKLFTNKKIRFLANKKELDIRLQALNRWAECTDQGVQNAG